MLFKEQDVRFSYTDKNIDVTVKREYYKEIMNEEIAAVNVVSHDALIAMHIQNR